MLRFSAWLCRLIGHSPRPFSDGYGAYCTRCLKVLPPA